MRLGNQRTFGLLQAQAVSDLRRHLLDLDADPAAADRALVLELLDDILHRRSRDRERNADAAARRRIDRGVHANHIAFGVEGRTTRVALVNRCVDLNEIVIRTVADVTAACRNNACGHGAAEAERIADREDPVTDARLTVGKLGERHVADTIDLDQCEVGARIGADHLGGVDLAVICSHFNLVGAIDHVIVGHGKTISRDEESRALPGHLATATTTAASAATGESIRTTEAAEEALHRRVRRERIVFRTGALTGGRLLADADADRDHRRLHTLDDVGKADRLLNLTHFLVDLRMRGRGEQVEVVRRRQAVSGNAETRNHRRHQRELARGENRAAWSNVGRQFGKIGGAVGHEYLQEGKRRNGFESRGACVHLCSGRWGAEPYRALTTELMFCNKISVQTGTERREKYRARSGAKNAR